MSLLTASCYIRLHASRLERQRLSCWPWSSHVGNRLWRGPCGREPWEGGLEELKAGSSWQPTGSWRLQPYNHKDLNSANNTWAWKRTPTPDGTAVPADTMMVAYWDSEQRTQLSRAWTTDPQKLWLNTCALSENICGTSLCSSRELIHFNLGFLLKLK